MAWVNNNGANVLQLTRCFNLLITEDRLNQEIRSTQDLPVLCSLLEAKLHLINDSKHSPVIYPIDFILSKFNTTNADVLLHTVKVALMVQPDVGEQLKLFKFIKENISAEPLQYLKLLKILLDLCKCKKTEHAFIQYVDHSTFDLIISNLISTDSKPVTNYLNVNILPYYLNLNCDSSKNLFTQILKQTLESKNLDSFCANPQIFIENNDVLLKDDRFWYMLQTCLNNNNSTVQKQALFILKKAIYFCQRLKCFNTTLKVVSWNADSKTQAFLAWQNLFILYEVSREKQLHLIEPVYQLIPTIKTLHPSWLSSVFRIFLLHQQQAVSSYILLDLLKSNWYYEDAVFKDVVQSLNKTEIALNESVWMHLSVFTQNLSNEKFILLLQETVNISWIPPVCYRLYRTIFTSTTDIFIPISLTSQIISNLRKLPHTFIRDECLHLIIEYVHKAHFEPANFRESLELNKIFFKDNFELWKRDNFQKFICDIRMTIKSWIESVDLKEVEALLKIIESLNNDDLESLLYKLFTNNELSNAILDRLCVLFHHKGVNILSYLNSRLISMKKYDDSYLREIAPILTIHQSDEILETCFRVLLSNESNDVQVEISFEIVNHMSEIINTTVLEEVLIKWETNFLENKNCNPHTCLSFLQLYSKKRIILDQSRTIQIFEHILETQEFVVVPEIFAQLKFLINSCADVKILFPFIDLCAQKLLELKGSAFFKAAVENFINSILLNNVILFENKEIVFAKCRDLLRLLFKWVNTAEVVGYSLSKSLCKLSQLNSDENAFKFIPVALKLLLFGDILKKDQRAEYEVCQIISQTNSDKSSKNPNLRKIAIRGEIIKYLQNILNNERDVTKREQKANMISALLLKKYSRYVNKRCFSDSQVHLIKLRILQALVLIHDKMGNKEDLIDNLLNSLCTESHQPSNKFIVIWLLIRLLHVKDDCLDLISAKIKSTNKMHSSTIFAFIPVLYHVALLKNEDAFSVKVLKQLLPWTMGAHFILRLYAQVGIKKIYDRINNKEVRDQFKEVVEGVVDVFDKTERDIEAFDKYMFDVFNPMTDFNQETIYYTIPHITNVTNDEYENISSILNFSSDPSPNLDALRTVQLKYKKQIIQNISTSVIQKKIIPQDSVHRKIGELIVVASLVDKIPNLGGISRTSEVFGVKELVINSLAIIKNSEFQSLSMSSENWINISEVKVDDLQLFLLAMKEKGFMLVGAEQTCESVKLNNFNFPCKCLLLLGNEKEGIPPNLLSLIDICVEIPQLGVVRSLNVHVAAATFIWEYTKAHML